MKSLHVTIATTGSILLHVLIAYALFMGSVVSLKPALQEFIVTNVTLLEEPLPIPEVAPQVLPPKLEPVVIPKPQKSVKKVVAKSESIQKPIITESFISEPIVESSVAKQETSQNQAHPTTVVARKSDDILLLYLSKVRHKIQESLRYPSMAKKMGLEGEAVVQFLIHSNGMVHASSIKIAKSSGKAILDRHAVDAVMEALPFELPPKEELEIAIPVVFKLKS